MGPGAPRSRDCILAGADPCAAGPQVVLGDAWCTGGEPPGGSDTCVMVVVIWLYTSYIPVIYQLYGYIPVHN